MTKKSLTSLTFEEWWEKYKKGMHYWEAPWVDQTHYSIYSVRAAAKTAWDAACKAINTKGK
jgi:hypothetical protein